MEHEKEIIKELLSVIETLQHAFEPPEEIAPQFHSWILHVTDALEAAEMESELKIWQRALETVSFSDDGSASLTAQMASLRTVLLGVQKKLEKSGGVDSVIKNRHYYSIRTGKNPAALKFDLTMVLRLFIDIYKSFDEDGYFQQAFGYYCVDDGEVPGILGSDIGAQMFRRLRKENLWPIKERCVEYSEDDLFDVIEFVYDCVSRPIDGRYHNFSNCGWHYYKFDREAGRREFRTEINTILVDYNNGYELSEDGEILALAENGLTELIETPLPTYDPDNVDNRVKAAIRKFRRYRSSQDDRRDAVRDLADILEFIRPQLGQVLTKKDENDLFNIANNFGVRHHNDQQRTDYDKDIWHNWMFYYYLATIYSVIALLKKNNPNTDQQNNAIPF